MAVEGFVIGHTQIDLPRDFRVIKSPSPLFIKGQTEKLAKEMKESEEKKPKEEEKK